jgi:uncharacterized membrane protein
VTMGVEVPLNDQLAQNGNRPDFENVWVLVNDLRAVLNTLALACLVPALAGKSADVSG